MKRSPHQTHSSHASKAPRSTDRKFARCRSEFARLDPLLPSPASVGRLRLHPLREILNSILYVAAAWLRLALPHEFRQTTTFDWGDPTRSADACMNSANRISARGAGLAQPCRPLSPAIPSSNFEARSGFRTASMTVKVRPGVPTGSTTSPGYVRWSRGRYHASMQPSGRRSSTLRSLQRERRLIQ